MASSPDQDDLSGRPLSELARFHSPVVETASFVPLAPASDAKQVHIHRARHSINEMRSILSEIRSMRSENSLSPPLSARASLPSDDDAGQGSQESLKDTSTARGHVNRLSGSYNMPSGSIPALSPNRYRSVSSGIPGYSTRDGPRHGPRNEPRNEPRNGHTEAFFLAAQDPAEGNMSKSTSGNTLTLDMDPPRAPFAETDDGHSDLFESASESPDKGVDVPPRRSSVNWSAGGGLQDLYEAGVHDSNQGTPVPASTQFVAYKEFVTPKEYLPQHQYAGEHAPQPPPHDRSFGQRSVSAPVPTERFAPSKAEFDETLQECVVREPYTDDSQTGSLTGSLVGSLTGSQGLSHHNSVSSSVYHNSPTSIRRAERARQDTSLSTAAVPETVVEVSPEADVVPASSGPASSGPAPSGHPAPAPDSAESALASSAPADTSANLSTTPPTTPPFSGGAAAMAATAARLEGGDDDAAALDGPKRTATLRTKRASHHSRHASVIDTVSDHRSSIPSELAFQSTPRDRDSFDAAGMLHDNDYEVRRRSADILSGRYSATSLDHTSSGEWQRRHPPAVQTPQPPGTPLATRHSVHPVERAASREPAREPARDPTRDPHAHARSQSYEPRRRVAVAPEALQRHDSQRAERTHRAEQADHADQREQSEHPEPLHRANSRRRTPGARDEPRAVRASAAAQQRYSHVSGTSSRRAFRKKSIESLLRKSDDFDLDDIDLPPVERHLLEKFVDAVSKLSVEIQLDEGKRVEGRRRLNNALRAIEGWF